MAATLGTNNVIANGDALGFSCCDGQLASDDFGNIFLTYLSSSIAVKMAISTDGGATFQPLTFLEPALGFAGMPLEKSGQNRPDGQWRSALDRGGRGQRLDFVDLL